MSSLGRLMKDYIESRNGRIRWYPNFWQFIDLASKRAKIVNMRTAKGLIPWPSRKDDDGREFSLFSGRSARCPHPDKWLGKYPNLKRTDTVRYFTVRANECKACEFHEAAKAYGSKRYASCRWDRENNGMDHPLQLISKAVGQANEIIGGRL